MNKIKNIFLLFSLVFVLTGCTARIEEIRQKATQPETEEKIVEEEVVKEDLQDPKDMSLDELEEELEGMEELEIEEDLDKIEEEF